MLYRQSSTLEKMFRQKQNLENVQNRLNEFLVETESRIMHQLKQEVLDLDQKLKGKDPFEAIKQGFLSLLAQQENKKRALVDFLKSKMEQEIFFEDLLNEIKTTL